MSKSILAYFANNERELVKEKERQERERLKRLMNEDEEGYRELVDEKKDARLTLLLCQTDAYINSLKQLVREHQQVNRSQERSDKTIIDKYAKSKKPIVNSSSILQQSQTR